MHARTLGKYYYSLDSNGIKSVNHDKDDNKYLIDT